MSSSRSEQFKTPCNIHQLSIISNEATDAFLSDGKLIIPASPAMKKLGFGTGVKVFLLERFSPNRGHYGSPWAIKKINSQLSKCAASKATAEGNSKDEVLLTGGCVVKRKSVAESCNSRLEAEAKLLRSFNHPNIIGFRSYTTALDGSKCLAMEASERDLNSILENLFEQEDDPLPSFYMHKVCLDVSKALHYLHETHRLLHGDIKSANILIKGDFNQVKLCDFGVCLKLDQKLTALPGQCYIGTECWSPPEVLIGDVPTTDRADVFAFGLTIWECVALSPPHINLLNSGPGEELLTEQEQDQKSEEREEVFQQQLGKRPALPLVAGSLKGLYLPLLETFHQCTSAVPADRPSAKQLVEIFTEMDLDADHSTNKTIDIDTTIEIDTTVNSDGSRDVSADTSVDRRVLAEVTHNNMSAYAAEEIKVSGSMANSLFDPVKVGPVKLFGDDYGKQNSKIKK
uniref:Lymphokine-activated killer T-cell-originated protein kinase-like n=1 Tax=Hirondellea gigas TaxID=1518452 RepID=A0A2P2HZK7_9CRUS